MNAKQKAIEFMGKHRFDNKYYGKITSLKGYSPEVLLFNDTLNLAIQEAKKEVFDDIDKEMVADKPYGTLSKDIQNLKKKHLGGK